MYDFDLYGFSKIFLNSVTENEFNKEFVDAWKNLKKDCEKKDLKKDLFEQAEEIEFEEIIETNEVKNNDIKLLQ